MAGVALMRGNSGPRTGKLRSSAASRSLSVRQDWEPVFWRRYDSVPVAQSMFSAVNRVPSVWEAPISHSRA